MTRYRMNGKVYTEDEIRKACRTDLADLRVAIRNEGGTPPRLSVEDYLTESVHTGTIEIVADEDDE